MDSDPAQKAKSFSLVGSLKSKKLLKDKAGTRRVQQ